MLKADHENARDLRRDPDRVLDRDAADEDDALDAAGEDATADERSRASQLWLVAACVCLFAAAALWLLGHADAAFVVAALGVVSWFLNVRGQLRHKNSHGDTEARR